MKMFLYRWFRSLVKPQRHRMERLSDEAVRNGEVEAPRSPHNRFILLPKRWGSAMHKQWSFTNDVSAPYTESTKKRSSSSTLFSPVVAASRGSALVSEQTAFLKESFYQPTHVTRCREIQIRKNESATERQGLLILMGRSSTISSNRLMPDNFIVVCGS